MYFLVPAQPSISSLTLQQLIAETPARVIAIAGTVSVLTQALKRYFPGICGKYAMAVNLALSLAGIFATMNPAEFWTVSTLQCVVTVFTAAAGIHSTARAMRRDDGTKTSGPGLATVAPMFAMLLITGVLMAGCAAKGAHVATPLPIGAIDQVDATANQTLQTVHAFAVRVSTDAQSGELKLTADQRLAINRVNAALNVADAAEQSYHAGQGGSASALTASVAAVQTAFSQAQSLLASSIAK